MKHGVSCSDDFFRKNCGTGLDPVLEAIKLHQELGVRIDITTLRISELNDSEENRKEIVARQCRAIAIYFEG